MSLSNKLSITDVELKDKRVLIRVSSNTPDPNEDWTADDELIPSRSISTSPLTRTRMSRIRSASPVPSQQSNMPLTTEPRP